MLKSYTALPEVSTYDSVWETQCVVEDRDRVFTNRTITEEGYKHFLL